MKKILFVLFLLGLVSDSIFASSPTKPIEVGTGNAYRPFAFVNDKNQMDGFDIDVLKILNKHDKGLNFKFNGVQWNAVFPGLDRPPCLPNHQNKGARGKIYLFRLSLF